MRTFIKHSSVAFIDILSHPFVLLLASALPIFLWPFAPIIDAPNHLARIWLESQSQLTGIQAQSYIIDWQNTSANYMVDLIGEWILRISSLRVVMTLLLLAMIIGPAMGVMLIAKRLYGCIPIYSTAALTAIWGQSMGSGFINYSISLTAAAFLFLFGFRLMQERGFWRPSAVRAASIIIVYLVHPFGILFFGMLDAAVIYGADVKPSIKAHFAFLQRILTSYIIPICALSLYIVFNRSINPVGKYYISYGGLVSHIVSIGSPFFAYNEKIEIIMIVPMTLLFIFSITKKYVQVHVGFVFSAMILLMGSMCIPDFIGDGAWLTRRLPLMAALIFFLSFRPRGVQRFDANAIVALTICAHCCWIDWVWFARSSDFADLMQIASALPPNKKVIVARNFGFVHRWDEPGKYVHGPQYTRRHLPALLVPLAHAYIPTLFAIRGQQPLRINVKFQHMSSPSSAIPSIAELDAHRSEGDGDIYLARWECDFDYLLVLEQDETGRSAENFKNARLVKNTASERLYKLNGCPPTSMGNI